MEELAPHIEATKDLKWEPYVKHRQVFGILLCLKCDMFNDIVQCPEGGEFYLEESHVYDAVQSLESFIEWIDTIKRLFPPSGLAVPPPTLCEFSYPISNDVVESVLCPDNGPAE